jgi:hypothetical protein
MEMFHCHVYFPRLQGGSPSTGARLEKIWFSNIDPTRTFGIRNGQGCQGSKENQKLNLDQKHWKWSCVLSLLAACTSSTWQLSISITSVKSCIKLMTNPPVAHGPKSKDALPGGQRWVRRFKRMTRSAAHTQLRTISQMLSQCSLNCIKTWDRTEYACILIISYNHSLQFSSSTSEKVLNTRNFTTTFAKFYHFYLQSCYVRCPESAPFNEMAGYSSVPAGIRSWRELRHPEVMIDEMKPKDIGPYYIPVTQHIPL